MTERDPILDHPAADFYRVVGDDDDYHRDALGVSRNAYQAVYIAGSPEPS